MECYLCKGGSRDREKEMLTEVRIEIEVEEAESVVQSVHSLLEKKAHFTLCQ